MGTHQMQHSALAVALATVLAAAAPTGVYAQQIIADGDDQTPAAGDYSASGVGNPAFHALNGGSIVPLGAVNVSAAGDSASAARAEGAGSRIELTGSTLTTSGFGAMTALATTGGELRLTATDVINKGTGMGIVAHTGSRATLQDVNIRMQGVSSVGLGGGGDISMTGGSISAMGLGSRAVSATGANMALAGVAIEGASGIWLADGNQFDISGSTVKASEIALDVNGRRNAVTVADSRFHSTGDGIATVNMVADSTLAMARSTVISEGDRAVGIDVRSGAVDMDSVQVTTSGANSHGLYADFTSFGDRPVIDARGGQVRTSGVGAAGAIVRNGGSIHLRDSSVLTTGSRSHGVVSGGTGEMTLSNSHVRAEGEGAWAAVINDRGLMRIDGGSLVSAQHGGIWVRSSRDAGLTLGNGAVVSGGNGIGLALDAAVAGRFDVALQGGSQLQGDIVITPEDEDAGLVPQSEVHMRLADGSLWQGRSHLLQSLALEGASQWTLTGDATVGELQVRDSGVALSDGSGRFNTLTVDGNLHSDGATFLFQGALGGDGSPIDRLHVRGDTSGDARVSVKNIGGAGAQTVNGIEVIRVDGLSDGRFDLAGRAVGGQYEYFLHKGGVAGGAGNWYLRSQLLPPDPCDVDPTLPECGAVVDPPIDPPIDPPVVPPVDPIPDPVLRPEGGAYLANLSAAQDLFALGYHQRQAGQNGGRGWARVDGGRSGFDAVSRQLDVRGHHQALSVGADLLRSEGGSAFGLMLSSGTASSTSTNVLTGYYARGRVKGEALGLYGTWRAASADPYAGLYVDGSLQRAQFRNRVEGVALTPERYDSKAWQGALEAGYALRVGGAEQGGLFLEPQLQVGYTRWERLRHTEDNGTLVTAGDASGVSGRAGVRLSGVTRWSNGAAQVQPYLAVHWLHQRNAVRVLMDDEAVDARIPRSRAEFSGGASVKFAGGAGMWGGLSLQRAGGYYQTSAQVGVSYSW